MHAAVPRLFGFSRVDGVLDSDEFDLEVDLSDAEGDSESGI